MFLFIFEVNKQCGVQLSEFNKLAILSSELSTFSVFLLTIFYSNMFAWVV